MSEPPRDAVFSGLDAFDDTSDAMDTMLLNLATTTDSDWAHLDSLPSDIYTNPYPTLPLHYIDSTPDDDNSPHQAPQQPQQQPAQQLSAAKPPARSPRSKVSTSTCTNCGKAISNNGANFKRHETACRRTKTSPKLAQQSSPSQQPPQRKQTQTSTLQPATAISAQQQQQQQPQHQHTSAPHRTSGPSWSRRDTDLLNVVRRLEQSIDTLDVSARLCLRDALLSLSNKASNPASPPTPQQEAMNRAAEYLVLRMLFLSGQQVMHTPPGTASTPYQETSVSQRPQPVQALSNDGTVAASTSTALESKDDMTDET